MSLNIFSEKCLPLDMTGTDALADTLPLLIKPATASRRSLPPVPRVCWASLVAVPSFFHVDAPPAIPL